jgi:hypothetical protein
MVIRACCTTFCFKVHEVIILLLVDITCGLALGPTCRASAKLSHTLVLTTEALARSEKNVEKRPHPDSCVLCLHLPRTRGYSISPTMLLANNPLSWLAFSSLASVTYQSAGGCDRAARSLDLCALLFKTVDKAVARFYSLLYVIWAWYGARLIHQLVSRYRSMLPVTLTSLSEPKLGTTQ